MRRDDHVGEPKRFLITLEGHRESIFEIAVDFQKQGTHILEYLTLWCIQGIQGIEAPKRGGECQKIPYLFRTGVGLRFSLTHFDLWACGKTTYRHQPIMLIRYRDGIVTKRKWFELDSMLVHLGYIE